MVESDRLGRLLKLPTFVVQKAAAPKNRVEICQEFIDDIPAGSFAVKVSEPARMSPF